VGRLSCRGSCGRAAQPAFSALLQCGRVFALMAGESVAVLPLEFTPDFIVENSPPGVQPFADFLSSPEPYRSINTRHTQSRTSARGMASRLPISLDLIIS
jgi:hypothetical protein